MRRRFSGRPVAGRYRSAFVKAAALLFLAGTGLASLGVAETWGLPTGDVLLKAWHYWAGSAALLAVAIIALKVPDVE